MVASLALIACWIMGICGLLVGAICGSSLLHSFQFAGSRSAGTGQQTVWGGARGTAMGVSTTSQFLGIFAGGALGGWILSFSDYQHSLIR